MSTSAATVVVSLWFSSSQYRTTAKAARVAATACDAVRPCGRGACSTETVNKRDGGGCTRVFGFYHTPAGVRQHGYEIGEEAATAAGKY